MMLTLLRVFPEEAKTIRVGENRRRAIREELAAGGTDVMNYLVRFENGQDYMVYSAPRVEEYAE